MSEPIINTVLCCFYHPLSSHVVVGIVSSMTDCDDVVDVISSMTDRDDVVGGVSSVTDVM